VFWKEVFEPRNPVSNDGTLPAYGSIFSKYLDFILQLILSVSLYFFMPDLA
jgi:hypothetical protein